MRKWNQENETHQYLACHHVNTQCNYVTVISLLSASVLISTAFPPLCTYNKHLSFISSKLIINRVIRLTSDWNIFKLKTIQYRRQNVWLTACAFSSTSVYVMHDWNVYCLYTLKNYLIIHFSGKHSSICVTRTPLWGRCNFRHGTERLEQNSPVNI